MRSVNEFYLYQQTVTFSREGTSKYSGRCIITTLSFELVQCFGMSYYTSTPTTDEAGIREDEDLFAVVGCGLWVGGWEGVPVPL